MRGGLAGGRAQQVSEACKHAKQSKAEQSNAMEMELAIHSPSAATLQ